MKKLVFMLIAVLSVALTSCSAFESEPIEPNIIGTGNLQYEAKSGTWFVVVDSTQYTVAQTQSFEPVEEMLVTIFTSPRKTGAPFMRQIIGIVKSTFCSLIICQTVFGCSIIALIRPLSGWHGFVK